MNAKTLLLIPVLLVTAGPWQTARAGDDLKKTFQDALFEEEANRDLEAAIAGYEEVIAQLDRQRQLAASAVFRLAECYRKLDQREKAVAQYRRLLNDFPGEATLAKLSRENLVALGETLTPGAAPSAGAEKEGYVVLAGERERLKEIDQIIANSPDLIDAPGEDGFTLLEAAARDGQLAAAANLIGNGAKIDLVREGQNPPLLQAAAQGHLKLVTLLLENGADIDLQQRGRSALMIAIVMKRETVARELIERGADLTQTFNLLEEVAGEPEYFRIGAAQSFYLPNGSTNSRTGEIEKEVSLNGNLLHLAIVNKAWPIADLLLDKGVSATEPAQFGITPLHLALRADNIALARRLLDMGADVAARTERNETPLGFACRRRSLELYTLLREFGADVNQPSWRGDPPLTIAWSSRELCEALIADGADVNAVNDDGQTALSEAVLKGPSYNGFAGQARLLLENGADPNQGVTFRSSPMRDPRHGVTPFMLVFPLEADFPDKWLQARREIADALIEHGADVHARDATGANALFYQLTDGPGLDLLMELGLDPLVRNKNGLTAFEMGSDRAREVATLFRYTHYQHLKDRDDAIWISFADPENLRAWDPRKMRRVFDAHLPGAEAMTLADLFRTDFAQAKETENFPYLQEARVFRGGKLMPAAEIFFKDQRPPGKPGPWDIALQAGDVVEVLSTNSYDPSIWWTEAMTAETRQWLEAGLPRSIRVSLGDDGDHGEDQTFAVIPPRTLDFIYEPSHPSLEALTVREFLEKAGRLGPEIDRRQVEVLRADAPGSPVTLDLTAPDADAYLLPGDSIRLTKITDKMRIQTIREQGIYVSRPGDHFIQRIYERNDQIGNQFTLADLLVHIDSEEDFVLPRPDLAGITIRRNEVTARKPKASADAPPKLTEVVIKLAAQMKALVEPEAGDPDPEPGIVPLQWGDIVIVPRKADGDGLPWAGLDMQWRSALRKSWSRYIYVTVQGGSTNSIKLTRPPFADYEFRDGYWNRRVDGSAERTTLEGVHYYLNSPVSDEFKLTREDPSLVVIFDENSPLHPRDVSLRSGDHLHFNPRLDRAPKPAAPGVEERAVPLRNLGTPSKTPRRRVVLPAP